MQSELDQAYKQQVPQQQQGHYTTNIATTNIATTKNGVGDSDGCRYVLDAEVQLVNVYKQAQHDFASGIKQNQFTNVDYQS